jgi:hypothetical protein
MSEDESVEAGRHTGQAFKALPSAALVVADAHRQRQVREMRRMENDARDRERDAERRGAVDDALGRVATDTPAERPTPPQPVPDVAPGVVEDPVTLAERWAAAQQPGADPAERVDRDKRVAEARVDPQEVRDEHAQRQPGSGSVAGRTGVEPAGRTADTLQREGVWQDGSADVARAGLSYTRTPGATITPGLPSQRRPQTAGKAAARTRDLGR